MTHPNIDTAAGTTAATQTNGNTGDPNTVELDQPIMRGQTAIKSVVVTRPNAGALRGTTLVALANMDVAALQTVIPRVTNPSISSAEVALMDPADLATIGSKVSSFLLTKRELAAFPGL